MKKSIKFRITLWFTGIFFLVLLGIFLSIYLVSSSYSLKDVRYELQDELSDFCETLDEWKNEHPDETLEHTIFEEKWVWFYDDNVMLSVYTPDGKWINGYYPDDFSIDTPFQEKVRQWKDKEETWLLTDFFYENGSAGFWIRAIASYTSWTRILHQMLSIFVWIFPFMIIFTGFIGYQMLKKALYPIYTISDTAKEIEKSTDLSKRIPDNQIENEFHCLTDAFNNMLQDLEMVFQREKQFTSDAAHELRTPISVILGQCEYILEDLNIDDECRNEILIIQEKVRQLHLLVAQLLSIARTENQRTLLEKEPVDLTLVAESVLEELENKANERQITLHLEQATPDLMLSGDMLMLMRMLVNLVENGITYGKRGGNVTIQLTEEGHFCQIQVIDDGIGILPEHLEKIWNRFYRVDASRSTKESFGLGLYMVKQIVQLHSGTIQVSSTYGEGTCFIVQLPKE